MTTETNAARGLVTLEQIGERRFRSVYNQDNHSGAIFGGQALGQALGAAQRTVPGWLAHSSTGYFLRGGAVAQPVEYEVEAVRDGRRFTSRRVVASQAGKPIFDLLCSFHDPEDGFTHQIGGIDDVPAPEGLPNIWEFVASQAHRIPAQVASRYNVTFPVELRLVDPEQVFFGTRGEVRRDYWFRMPSASVIADPRDQECLLAFLSDFWLAGTAGSVHLSPMDGGKFSIVTLNHSMWFHGPARVDEWLLYRTDTPWTGEGRGLVRGLIYARSGLLVASSVQEVCMRSA